METKLKELDSIIDSGDTEKLSEYLENLDASNIDPLIVQKLCWSLQIENKALRNLIIQYFVSNRFPSLPSYLVKYISSKDISVRNLAGEVLIQYGLLSVDSVIKFIEESDNDLDIKFAADILAINAHPKVEAAFFDLLKRTSNDNVIISCIEGLGQNKSASAVEQLKQLYSKKDIFKPYVIDALKKIETKESFEFIKECYDDPDLLVKYNVIESLGIIGDEDTYFFLINELQKAEDSLAQPIIESIFKLQSKYGFELPYNEKIKRAVLLLLNQNEIENIKVVIQYLSSDEDPEILYEILRYYGKDEEVDFIIYKKILNDIHTSLTIFPLILASNPKNLVNLLSLINLVLENNSDIVSSTNKILLHKMIDSVSRCLTHSDEMVRLISVEILFKLDLETALILLDDEFLNVNFWIKYRLLEMVETFNHPKIDELLLKLSEDDNEMIRQKANEVRNIKNFSLFN